jgi:hypothetical protein
MATGSGKTRKAQALTDKAIKAMKPDPAGAYRVPDLRSQGLALRVAVDGGKTWDLAYRIKGKGFRRLSLCRYEDVGLEPARSRANELTSTARQGHDLIAEEAAALDEYDQSFNIGRLIAEYAKRRLKGRLKTASEIERRIHRALAPVIKRKATDIRRRDLRQLLDAVADQGHEGEAEKQRSVLQPMFRWALRQDIIEIDPSAGLSPYGHSGARERVLDPNEIRALWSWLGTGDMSSHISDILRVQLCLGARVGEVCGLMAEEFERDVSGLLLWNLPSARSKNGSSRLTPIVGPGAGDHRTEAKGRKRGRRPAVCSHIRNKPERRSCGTGNHPAPRPRADRGIPVARPAPDRRHGNGEARSAARPHSHRARPEGRRTGNSRLAKALRS